MSAVHSVEQQPEALPLAVILLEAYAPLAAAVKAHAQINVLILQYIGKFFGYIISTAQKDICNKNGIKKTFLMQY